jgi:hypothetical protein
MIEQRRLEDPRIQHHQRASITPSSSPDVSSRLPTSRAKPRARRRGPGPQVVNAQDAFLSDYWFFCHLFGIDRTITKLSPRLS